MAFTTFCCNSGRDRVMGTRTAWPLNCRIQGCLLALSLGSWVTPGRACPQSEPPSPCLCNEDIKLDPCIQTLSPYLFMIFTTSPNHLYLFYLISRKSTLDWLMFRKLSFVLSHSIYKITVYLKKICPRKRLYITTVKRKSIPLAISYENVKIENT